MTKEVEKARKQNGQYDFTNMQLRCKCGHVLGLHTAGENGDGMKDCVAGDFYGYSSCNCTGFTTKK